MFHPADPSFQVLVSSLDAINGASSRRDITVIEFLLIIGMDGNDRLGFHQERGEKIEPGDRPESAEDETDHHDGPDPENGKIEIIGYALTHAQYYAVAGTMQSAA